jgi:hypothetical protein
MNDYLYSGISFSLIVWSFLMIYLYRYRNLLAIFLIFIFALQNLIIFGLDLSLIDDAETYHLTASYISKNIKRDFFQAIEDIKSYRQPSFTFPLGLMYSLFGASHYVGKLFSSVFGLFVLVGLYSISCQLFSRKVAIITTLLMTSNPYFLYISCAILRDIMISFFIIFFFKMLLDIYDKRGSLLWNLIQLLFIMLYLTFLRSAILYILCISIFTWWLVPDKRHNHIHKIMRYVLLLGLITAGGLGFMSLRQSEKADTNMVLRGHEMADLRKIQSRTNYEKINANSAYLTDVYYNSYTDIIRNLPITTFYFMFSPLPWEVKSLKQGTGLIDSFILIIIYILSIKELFIFTRYNNKLAFSFIVFLVVGIMSSSILASNAGSAIRHRTMFTYLLFPFAAAQIMRVRNKKSRSCCTLPQTRYGKAYSRQ